MLEKGFFNVEPFNPNPYLDPVIVDLSGAQKFEENTIFKPGRYRIEVAPGNNGLNTYSSEWPILNMNYIETINEPFIIRAYCGGDGNFLSKTPGTNPYSGIFKVNGIDARTINRDNCPNGIDVTHIFGAGGGNGKFYNSTSGTGPGTSYGGGPNCLGDGNICFYSDTSTNVNQYGGAGSCLHLLPVSGVFGTDYLRAYQASPFLNSGTCGSVYGGGGGHRNGWHSSSLIYSRGGNSPYGNGAEDYYDSGSHTTIHTDTGIGGGNKVVTISGRQSPVGAGAYFDGTQWNNATGYVYYNGSNSSYIRITYLGPLV